MNTLKKYFTKECAKRTFRTFIQTACGYAVMAVWGDNPTVDDPMIEESEET